mmetsp:Transcript_8022/g.30038  ORF Transcript_8022/g.30038 Transcript_8022/m.30038 type:complete len:235 (+) Transcript_8022:3435-4139(+)
MLHDDLPRQKSPGELQCILLRVLLPQAFKRPLEKRRKSVHDSFVGHVHLGDEAVDALERSKLPKIAPNGSCAILQRIVSLRIQLVEYPPYHGYAALLEVGRIQVEAVDCISDAGLPHEEHRRPNRLGNVRVRDAADGSHRGVANSVHDDEALVLPELVDGPGGACQEPRSASLDLSVQERPREALIEHDGPHPDSLDPNGLAEPGHRLRLLVLRGGFDVRNLVRLIDPLTQNLR